MISLKRVSNKIREGNPYWSDFTCFAEAVRDRNFSKKTIFQHFNSSIDRGDYAESEKKQILEFLMELSKGG